MPRPSNKMNSVIDLFFVWLAIKTTLECFFLSVAVYSQLYKVHFTHFGP